MRARPLADDYGRRKEGRIAQSEFAHEVTSNRVLTIWWAFLWRALVWGAVVGGVLGFIAGFVAGLMGRVDMAPTAGFMAGWAGLARFRCRSSFCALSFASATTPSWFA